jgi:hypothetical protein
VISEVDRLAEEKRVKPEAAAAIMDAERDEGSKMAEYIERELPAKLAARKALQEAAAPAADAQANAAAAAAAAQATAAAAAAATAETLLRTEQQQQRHLASTNCKQLS